VHAGTEMVLVNSSNNGSTDEAFVTGKISSLYTFQNLFLQTQKRIAITICRVSGKLLQAKT
jgi:hypothetical protein